MFDFIWKQKPPEIKKTTLIKKKLDNGLEMKDFVLFNKGVKLTWIRRLCSDSDAPWKYIPKSFLSSVGGRELFKCNYDYSLLDLNNHLPEFYKQIINYWQEIASTTPSQQERGSLSNNLEQQIHHDQQKNGISTSMVGSRSRTNFRSF